MKFTKCLLISAVLTSIGTALFLSWDYIDAWLHYMVMVVTTYATIRYILAVVLSTLLIAGILWLITNMPEDNYAGHGW